MIPTENKLNDEMSDYEALRVKNIVRNNARLRELGLITVAEERESNECAHRRVTAHNVTATKTKSGVNRSLSDLEVSDEMSKKGSRKSLRLQGIGPHNENVDANILKDMTKSSICEERTARVQECREKRLRRAIAVSELGAEKAASENPTASYEHCLMRVCTMTEKGLANRVKVIERAAGKHCVVKMAIFKSCLQDQGLWDVADLAARSLERLKALQPVLNESVIQGPIEQSL